MLLDGRVLCVKSMLNVKINVQATVFVFWTNASVNLGMVAKDVKNMMKKLYKQNVKVVATDVENVVSVNVFAIQVSVVLIVKIVLAMNVPKVKV